MGILALEADERVREVRFTDDTITVDLMDGRTITVPLVWYPRLTQCDTRAAFLLEGVWRCLRHTLTDSITSGWTRNGIHQRSYRPAIRIVKKQKKKPLSCRVRDQCLRES